MAGPRALGVLGAMYVAQGLVYGFAWFTLMPTLAAAGVDVEHRLFEGMIHGFVALPVPLTQGAAALDYLCQRARQSLSN